MASKRPARRPHRRGTSRTVPSVPPKAAALLKRASRSSTPAPSRVQRAISSVKRLVKRLAPRPTAARAPTRPVAPTAKRPRTSKTAKLLTARLAIESGATAPVAPANTAPPASPSSPSAPPVSASCNEQIFHLPDGYHHTQIVLLVRDPWWLFSYWEVTPEDASRVREAIPAEEREGVVSVLRVYDVTAGEDGAPCFDITLRDLASTWYINVGRPDRAWIVEIGLRTPRGGFFRLARSNRVMTPRYGPSDVIDEEWMSLDEEYWKLFGVAGGFGIGKSSMEIRQRFREQLRAGLFSGGVSSFGASPVKLQAKGRGFWFWVDAELIVYGATAPDAQVTIQGQPVSLRPDGTFSVRMALPDGQRVIPVEATSADRVETRTITPIVTRATERTNAVNEPAAALSQTAQHTA